MCDVSVLMSIYKEPIDWITQSINSIIEQSFSSFEFIIINDNPLSQEHKKILENFSKKDSRIVIISNEKNLGLTKSLNVGINAVKGKYIARMDADDIAMPNRLELQYNHMEQNLSCVVCGSWMYLMKEQNLQLDSYPTENQMIKNSLLLKNSIPHPTAFIRTKVLQENVEYYNEHFKYSQDYDLWCKLAKYGTMSNLGLPLVKYRISSQQISTSKVKEQTNYAVEIRKSYLNYCLAENGIDLNDEKLSAKIKSLRVSRSTKGFLLASFYSNQKLINCFINPFLKGDIFRMKKLYFSALKRSFEYRNHT